MAKGRDKSGKFAPGSSGNPRGRPKEEVRAELWGIMVTTVTPERWAAIVTRAVEQAEKGDKWARKWLGEYLLGHPDQSFDLGKGESAIVVKFAKLEDESEGGAGAPE